MAKILIVSRCSWTLYNFRRGHLQALKDRNELVIGGGAGGDGFESKLEDMGVPYIRLPVDKRAINILSDLKLIFALFRWYRREKPQIIHHFTIKPVIYGSIAAKLAGAPRIINTVPGLGYVFTEHAPKWLCALVMLQYRIALACADHTFFENKEDRQLFLDQNLGTEAKTSLLAGAGIDIDYFQPMDTIQPDVNCVTFLMIARMLKDKGVYQFVDAARIVKKEFPAARFQLLGGRDERNPRCVPESELKQWQLEGVVDWTDQIEDVRPFIAASDVVVLPSMYREGLPHSLMEAASMGKAIITTNGVGCKDAVDDGISGILVPPGDVDSLASAMKKLIDSKSLRESMGRAGREKMVRDYDERKVVAHAISYYGPAFHSEN